MYSCLENPMDGGAWWATVHGVAKNWTWLSDFTHSLNLLTLHVSYISSMTGHTNLLYSSPNFEPAYCATSHYYWLISIQVSQETGNLVFPYLEEFSTVCCDPYSQRLLHSQWSRKNNCLFVFSGISAISQWSTDCWQFDLVHLPFLNQAYISGISQIAYCWILAWRTLSSPLLACELNTTVKQFERSLSLPFFGIEMEADLLLFCGHCRVFKSCWLIACSPLTASSFEILKSLAWILSPLQALFI